MLENSSSTAAPLVYYCSSSRYRHEVTTGFSTVKLLTVVPLCAFVLHLGLERWRRERSLQAVPHSDAFTFHLCALEQLWAPGSLLYPLGVYLGRLEVLSAGAGFFSIVFYGEALFHILTCADRYLAVVWPLTYLGLRGSRGVRVRNAAAGSVWLFCCSVSLFYADSSGKYTINLLLGFLAVPITAVTFYNVSVLLALLRPGPGGSGSSSGGRAPDQLKLRAFSTISAISVVLWLWFLPLLLSVALTKAPDVSEEPSCMMMALVSWFNLPTSLVSPLLFLHRTGKLAFWRRK